MAATTLVPAAAGFHDGAPLAYHDRRPGAASWGLEVDQTGEDDLAVDVLGHKPVTTSRLTVGGVVFDGDGNWRAMFAHTFLASPDRQVLRPAPEAGPVEPTHVTGDASALEDVELTVAGGGPSTSSNPDCRAWFCASITLVDRDPGTHRLIAWMGGVDTVEIEVHGDTIRDVDANAGGGVALGDAELPAGSSNVQAQHTTCDSRTSAPACPGSGLAISYDVKVGAKAIAGVDVPVDADQELWGFWHAREVTIVCQFTVGVCPHRAADAPLSECDEALFGPTGEHCRRADLALSGPHGIERDGRWQGHSLHGAPGGEYAFTVERMVDAWGPRVFDPVTSSFVFAGEYFTTLTLADVELPP